jgi:hypothetical protein
MKNQNDIRKHFERELIREAKIYISMIETAWRRSYGCHSIRMVLGNIAYIETPKIKCFMVKPDRILFEILLSNKSRIGWRNKLPLGVTVRALVDEYTIREVCCTLGRNVVAIPPRNGSPLLYVVHRITPQESEINRDG